MKNACQPSKAYLLQAGAQKDNCQVSPQSFYELFTYAISMCLFLLLSLTGHTKTTSVNVAPPFADFSFPDTIWVNSPVTIVNNSVGATNAYWDIVELAVEKQTIPNTLIPYMSNSFDFYTRFPFSGYYNVKLYVTNSGGSAEVTKTVFVYAPTAPPVANFLIPRKEYTNLETVQLYDLSTGGATSWKWTLTLPIGCSTCWGFNQDGASRDTVQNAYFKTDDGGWYKVCLVVSNSLGSNTICDSLFVIKDSRICNGGSNLKDTFSGEPVGYITDMAGASKDYEASWAQNCHRAFYFIPCADSLYLDVQQFDINYQTDKLIIYDGPTTSSPSYVYSGTYYDSTYSVPTIRKSLKRWYSNGGIVVIQSTSRSTGTSPGYLIKWTTSGRSFGVATPDFILPDTVYSGTSAYLQNTSSGFRYTNKWDTNDDTYFGDENYSAYDSLTTSPYITFINNSPSDTIRRYCLKVVNCAGYPVKCKSTVIRPVAGNPIAKFDVNTTSGFTEDAFQLVDRSLNGAIQWDWFITPAYARYVSGTNSHSKNPVVMFDYPGYYKIQLQVTNPLGNKGSIIKDSFIHILAYNQASSIIPLTASINDIGISRVVVNDLDVTTALQTPDYYFDPLKKTTLYRGGRYPVAVYRTTAVTSMNRKVWIDFNRNADFTDPGEEIITELSANTLSVSDSFNIALDAPLGTLRMRVGASLASTNLTSSSTNFGCYEDYSIVIGVDQTAPEIHFNGDSIIYIEVHKTYHDKGVIAIDNIEGDISSRYKIIGLENLDTSTVGYYTLQYYVEDSYGNRSKIITRLVNVVINSTGPSIVLNQSSQMGMEVFYGYQEPGYVATDNRGDTITKNVIVTGNVDTTRLGSYTLTYSITDAFNFTATKQRTVVVSDTTRPVLTLKGNSPAYHQQINTPLGIPVNDSDNYDKAPVISYTGLIKLDQMGIYTLVYSAIDSSGNISMPLSVDIKVDDFIPPSISLRGEDVMVINVKEYDHFSDIEPGYTATDNYYSAVVVDHPYTTVRMDSVGTYYITYTATDGSGNTANVTREIRIVDKEAPIILPNGPRVVNLKRFQPYVEEYVLISDNYYHPDDLMKLLRIENFVVNDIPGTYYVTYDVTDPSGNRASTFTRIVVVSDEVMTTGTNEVNSTDAIQVFPIPTRGLINISLPESNKAKSISVYNNLGVLVIRKECTPDILVHEVNLEGYATGIYFVKVEGESGTYTKKITLMK